MIDILKNEFKVALLWAGGIDDNTIHNISDTTCQQIDILIGDFLLLLNNEEMKKCEEDPANFGHWLALTSGGHGAGFFDSEDPIVSGIDAKLDDIMRHETPYQDDGIIYADFFTYGKG